MSIYFFVVLWLFVGAVAYLLSDDNPSTRGEFFLNLLFALLFMPLQVMFTIIDSEWWNEKL